MGWMNIFLPFNAFIASIAEYEKLKRKLKEVGRRVKCSLACAAQSAVCASCGCKTLLSIQNQYCIMCTHSSNVAVRRSDMIAELLLCYLSQRRGREHHIDIFSPEVVVSFLMVRRRHPSLTMDKTYKDSELQPECNIDDPAVDQAQYLRRVSGSVAQ